MQQLPDSGARRKFASGAVRDVADGKGRMDLVPIESIVAIHGVPDHIEKSLLAVDQFLESGDATSLIEAFTVFATGVYGNECSGIIEVSKHFEAGAAKYSASNWARGLPLHCYIDSALRHLVKFMRGDTDEPHDRAYLWNILCAHWTFLNKPELDDLETVHDVQ